ncbi:hypothetical protein COOONC_14443 [Cooperia oncophora]
MVILSTGSGVDGFTLDPGRALGNSYSHILRYTFLTKERSTASSEGHAKYWSERLALYIHDRKFPPVSRFLLGNPGSNRLPCRLLRNPIISCCILLFPVVTRYLVFFSVVARLDVFGHGDG